LDEVQDVMLQAMAKKITWWHYAQLVEEESTATVMARTEASGRAQENVLRLVQRPGEPFLADAEGRLTCELGH